MGGLKNYLIAVCSAAILCAILKQIAGKGKVSGPMVNLLSGMFVAICIISPWKDFSMQDIVILNPLDTQQASIYVDTGEEILQSQINSIITAQTEAYILEKANQMHVQLEVVVELSGDGVPERSLITGELSQTQKEELSAFLFQQIGIDREMQIWR